VAAKDGDGRTRTALEQGANVAEAKVRLEKVQGAAAERGEEAAEIIIIKTISLIFVKY